MDSGDGQVQGSLLLRLEAEVGEVVGVGVDSVPELLVPVHRLDQHRNALVPQQALVALEGLAPGAVAVRIAGHAVADLAQAERPRGIEEDQQEVRYPLESVKSLHRRQSRASRVSC